MGYPFKPNIPKNTNNFQFPLWDTAEELGLDPSELIFETFNSLYGILSLNSLIQVKIQ